MPPCGQAARRVTARRVAGYVMALSLTGLCGYPHKHLFASKNFGDATETEAGLLCDIAHRETRRLRQIEALAPRSASLVALILSAIELRLGAAYLGASFFLGVFRHGRSLCQREGTHANA